MSSNRLTRFASSLVATAASAVSRRVEQWSAARPLRFRALAGKLCLAGALAWILAPSLAFAAGTPTTTVVSSSASSVVQNAGFSLTATVTANSGGGTPSGQVTFYDGTAVLGTSALNAGGVATLNVTQLPVGSHTMVFAAYAGQAPYLASTSTATTITSTPAGGGKVVLVGSATGYWDNFYNLTAGDVTKYPCVAFDSGGTLYLSAKTGGGLYTHRPGDTTVVYQGSLQSTGTPVLNQVNLGAVTLTTCAGMAMDGGNILYMADSSNGNILEYNVAAATASVIGTGFTGVSALTVDGLGKLYVVANSNKLYSINPAGTLPVTESSLTAVSISPASGATLAQMTHDYSGDIFLLDTHNNEVYEYTPTGTFSTVLTRTIAGITSTSNFTGIVVSPMNGYLYYSTYDTTFGGHEYVGVLNTFSGATNANVDNFGTNNSGNVTVASAAAPNGLIMLGTDTSLFTGNGLGGMVGINNGNVASSVTYYTVSGSGYKLQINQASSTISESCMQAGKFCTFQAGPNASYSGGGSPFQLTDKILDSTGSIVYTTYVTLVGSAYPQQFIYEGYNSVNWPGTTLGDGSSYSVSLPSSPSQRNYLTDGTDAYWYLADYANGQILFFGAPDYTGYSSVGNPTTTNDPVSGSGRVPVNGVTLQHPTGIATVGSMAYISSGFFSASTYYATEGSLYISDAGLSQLVKMDLSTNTASLFGPANMGSSNSLEYSGVVSDPDANLYVTSFNDPTIYKVAQNGTVTPYACVGGCTIAGHAVSGYTLLRQDFFRYSLLTLDSANNRILRISNQLGSGAVSVVFQGSAFTIVDFSMDQGGDLFVTDGQDVYFVSATNDSIVKLNSTNAPAQGIQGLLFGSNWGAGTEGGGLVVLGQARGSSGSSPVGLYTYNNVSIHEFAPRRFGTSSAPYYFQLFDLTKGAFTTDSSLLVFESQSDQSLSGDITVDVSPVEIAYTAGASPCFSNTAWNAGSYCDGYTTYTPLSQYATINSGGDTVSITGMGYNFSSAIIANQGTVVQGFYDFGVSGSNWGNAASINVTLPSTVGAGTPFTATVTVVDANGATVQDYTGTVKLTSTDGAGVFPATYTFTTSDAGSHTFTNGITFNTIGSRKLTATDSVTSSITGNATTTVVTQAKLAWGTAPPASFNLGLSAGTVTVKEEDKNGNVVTTASDQITITVTGPGNYSQSYSATAVNGVATFSLSSALPTSGQYTYTATSGALAQVTASETVNGPTKLAFSPALPVSVAPGGNVSFVTVYEEFPDGTPSNASTDSITLTVSGPSGYSQVYTKSATSGFASFNLSSAVLNTTGTYTYTATSGSLTQAVGTVLVSGPSMLAYNPAPTATISTGGNAGTVKVDIEYPSGAVVTTSSNQVTLTVTGPGGYNHNYNATAASGIATFNLAGTALTVPGTYTYTATSGSLTQVVATESVVNPNTPAALKCSVPPPVIVVQGQSAGTVNVGIYNALNNIVNTANNVVTLTVSGPGGYNQVYTATAVNGTAYFDLSAVPLSTLGAYTYTATSGALTPATANETVYTAATLTPTQLVYQIPPPATLGTFQSPGTVTVAEENASGNVVTSATDQIVLTVTGPGGYKQTYQQQAVSGVATFGGLSTLSTSGAYTYTATTYIVATPAVANEVVTGGAVTTQVKLAFKTPPPVTLYSGQSAGTVVVAEEDTNSNVVTTANDSITLTVEGPTYQKTYTATAVNGLATFSASDILINDGYYAYVANTGNLTPVEANELVSANPSNIQLGWVIPPHLNYFATSTSFRQVNVAIEDFTGRQIVNKFDNITLTVTGPGGFSETHTMAAYDGIAPFNLSSPATAAGLYTFTATSGSLAPLVATANVHGPYADCAPAAVTSFAMSNPIAKDTVNSPVSANNQIQVYEFNASNNWVNTASDNITITVTGPGGYSYQASGQAHGGYVLINMGTVPQFTTPGVYSFTASNGTASSTFPYTVAAGATSGSGAANYIGLSGFTAGEAANEWEFAYNPGPSSLSIFNATEYTGNFQLDTSATDPITLTITGPNGAQLVYHSTAVNGIAGFYSQFFFDNNAQYTATLSSGLIPAMSANMLIGMPPSCFSIASGTGAELAFIAPPQPSIASGGNAGSAVKVGVEDVSGNVISSNSDTVTLTVTGPNGYLATYSSTAVSGIATFNLSAAILNTTGQYTYEATDAGLVPARSNEMVTSGSASTAAQLAITYGPQAFVASGATAGVVNVAIEDSLGNAITSASNSVTLTVTGPGAYSKTYTSTAFNGTAFFNLSSAVLSTTGVYTYIASSTGLNQAEATEVVYSSASPATYGAVASFAVFPQNYTVVQGTADALTVLALDANGNVVGNYAGTATLTTTDGAGLFSTSPVTFKNGIATSTVTLNTLGQQTVTATQGPISGTSNPITVITAPIVIGAEDKLVFTPPPVATLTSGGNAAIVPVSIEDVSGNVETSSTDTVVLTVTGPGGYLQTYSATAVNGIATYDLSAAILNSTGQYTYTATDSGLTPASATENVKSSGAAGAAAQLAFTPPPPAFLATGGNAGTVQVSVEDAGSNLVASASNSITLTVTGPGGYSQTYTQSAVNGVASFNLGSAALSTSGGYTYTATSSPLIPAVATEVVQTSSGPGSYGSVASFAVLAQNYTVAQNTADTLTVLALDPNGDIVGNFAGPATLTTTDAHGAFASSSVSFTNGVANTTATFQTAGQQTVTATQNAITGTSAPITVLVVAGPPSRLVFTTPPVPSVNQGGNAGTVAVTVEDANGNVLTSASGTVTLTVTGPGGYLETYTATIVNGVATFNLGPDILANPGAYTYTATDGALTPAVAQEAVTSGSSGTASQLAFTPPPPVFLGTGGNAGTVSVSVEDKNSNVVTSSSASITLTVTGPSGYSQTYTHPAVNGVATFNLSSAPLATGGVYTYTATASSLNPAVATELVQSANGQANYGAVAGFAVIAQNYTVSKGTPDTLTVLAVDANGNIVSNFSGPANLTTTDALGSFASTSVNFTNGLANTTGTFNTAGTQTVTATKNAITGTSANITVLSSLSAPPTAPVTGPAAGPLTVTAPFISTKTLGPISVLTMGAPNQDFQFSSGGTCAQGNTYNSGQSCTVNYTFTPKYPGLRKGAIQLTDNSGNVIQTIYISGIGVSPEVAFITGTATSLGSGFSNATGVALDGFNNVWATDPDNNQVKEILAAGGYTTVNTMPGTYNDPLGITVDGAGNVFVADTGNHAVKEIVAAGGYTTVSSVNSSLSYPIGITVDESGNLYVADSQANQVKELTVASNYATVTTLGSGFSGPQGVALDASDNLFVADTGHNAIKEATASSNYATVTTLGSGLLIFQPVGIALDAANNIYIGNNGFNSVNQLTVSSGYTSMNTLAGGLTAIQQVTLDGAGNVYAGVAGLNKVMKIDLTDGPTLNYGSQTDGTSSAPQSVVVNNIGNATLNAVSPGLSVSAEFTQVTGSGTPTDCTSALGMTTGGACNLSIEFTPVAPASGVVNGSAVLTDNSLNASPSTSQTINLTGTAVLPAGDATKTKTSDTLSTLIHGQSQTLTATVTDTVNANSIPVGQVTLTDTFGATVNTIGPLTLDGTGKASSTYIPAAGSHTVTSTFTPTNSNLFLSSADAVGVQFTVAAYGTVASFSVVPQNTTTTTGTPDGLTITAYDLYGNVVGNYNGTAALTSTDPSVNFALSTVTFTNGVATTTATFNQVGTQTVTATSGAITSTSPNITVNEPDGKIGGPGKVTFPNTPVGGPQTTKTVTLNVGNHTTIGSITVVTQGATGLDFTNNTSQTTCTTGTVSPAANCNVSVNFKPVYPGLRVGAIIVRDNNGNLLSVTYLSGIGTSPEVAFTPATISTIAGDGLPFCLLPGACGDNGPATSAQISNPNGLAFDGTGNLYVADSNNNEVRQVSPGGTIVEFAGTGNPCSSSASPCGDGGPASSADIAFPYGLSVDGAGNLYISDPGANRVRMVDPGTGIINTVAGNGSNCSPSTAPCGDGGPARSAQLLINGTYQNASGLVSTDSLGNLVIADGGDSRIRYVNNATGIITTIAGTGTPCNSPTAACGDGGSATAAQLNAPNAAIMDANGNLFIADSLDNRVREVAAGTGNITTIAGTGAPCSSATASCGDHGSATAAQLNAPVALALDAAGDLYIADSGDNRIRELIAATGTIVTVTGNGNNCQPLSASCGDGGPGTAASTYAPYGLTTDGLGNLYMADGENEVRKLNVGLVPAVVYPTPTNRGTTDTTDGTQTVIAQNIGNAALIFPAPASGANASISLGFTQSNTETCPDIAPGAGAASLASGASCTYVLGFAPTVVGANSGLLTLTDNALNVANATQSVSLSGTGLLPVAKLVFTTPPAATVAAGGNAGSSIAVAEEDGSGNVLTAGTDLVTLTVTGPNGYSKTYTSTAVNGVATFNLGSAILTASGGYTYTATIANPITNSAVSPETVNAGAAATITAGSGSGQSAVIGSAFATVLQATVVDAYSNPVNGVTVTFTAPGSGASATFSSGGSSATGTNGQVSVTATANAIASSTAYTVNASVAGVATPAQYLLTNTQATPAVKLTATPSAPITYGQFATTVASTVTYTVGTPTGTVSFTDGGSSFGLPVTLAAGAGSLAPVYLNAGPHALVANYAGDNNYVSAQSSPASYLVNKASTTLAGPATQPFLVIYQTSGSVPVTVAGQFSGVGIATPTGSLTYTITNSSNSAVASGSATISGGIANIPVASSLPPGAYTITLSYNGDSNYNAANSITSQLQVGLIAPTLNWPAPSAIPYGTNLTGILNAIAKNGASQIPGTYAYTATPSGGSASSVTNASVLPAGTYTLGVTFTPSDPTTYKSASTTVSLTVNKAAPTNVLGSSSNPILLLNPVTFTATVASSISTPTGTVTFFDGATPLGTLTLNGSGVATLATASLALGTHPITAVYSGDSNFTGLTSNLVNQVIEDFNLQISTAAGSITTMTVNPGQQATYYLIVGPQAPATVFPAIINLTASGLPAGATYTLTPNQLPAGSGNTPVTLVVNTPATSLARNHPTESGPGRKLIFGSGLTLALLLLPLSGRMRRSGRKLARVLVVLAAMAAGVVAISGLSGCNGYPTGFFGQSPQTYTITVTGTSGPLSHSTSVTLTIN